MSRTMYHETQKGAAATAPFFWLTVSQLSIEPFADVEDKNAGCYVYSKVNQYLVHSFTSCHSWHGKAVNVGRITQTDDFRIHETIVKHCSVQNKCDKKHGKVVDTSVSIAGYTPAV